MTPIAYINVEKRTLEFAKPMVWHTPTVVNLDRIPLFTKEALAQEQEPVAWVAEDFCEGQYINGRPRKIWWECKEGVGTAFYTHPPQRTWLGLSDEEVFEICNSNYNRDSELVKMVEAKLKQKNGYAEERNT